MKMSNSWELRGGAVVNSLMQDLALTREQAAGIVGNLGYESIGFTALQEIKPVVSGSKGGYGWGQWTASRRDKFIAWCAANNKDPNTDEGNYGYLLHDLTHDYAYVLTKVRAKTTLEECVFTFGRYYEVPYGTTATHLPGYTGRLNYAQRAYNGSQ